MIIFLITIVQILIFSLLYPKIVKKKPTLLIIVAVLLSPSAVLFNTNSVVFNQPISILIIIITYIFLFIFSRKFQEFHIRKPLSSIFKYVIAIILITIFCSLSNSLIFDTGTWYSHREFILQISIFFCFLALIYYYSFDLEKGFLLKSISKIFYFFILFTSSLALFSYIDILGVRDFHFNYYNFTIADPFFDYLLLSRDIDIKRSVFSTFSNQTQFGSFGSLGFLVCTYFYKNRYYNKNQYFLLFLLFLTIVITSESRTALIVFFITSLLVFYDKFGLKTLLFMPIVVLFWFFVFPFLSERTLLLFSSDQEVLELGYSQRGLFWDLFIDKIKESYYILLIGLPKSNGYTQFFESGYLNMINRGGIFGLFFYFLLLLKPIKYIKYKQNHYLKFFIFLLLFLEISQGVWLSFRMNFISAIAFLIIFLEHPLYITKTALLKKLKVR
jgi:hypothetical protein